jgi:hypothetical protein
MASKNTMYTIKDYPLKRVSTGDFVDLMGFQYQVMGNHLTCAAGGNGILFEALGWNEADKLNFFRKSYGYQTSGLWPTAKTKSDIVKSLNDLYDYISAKHSGKPGVKAKVPITIKEKPDCIEFSVYGETIRVYGNPIYMLKKVDNDNKKPS